MPSLDLKGYHNEFVEDERGEGYGNHAGTIDGANQELREALDDAALIYRDGNPDEEGAVAEGAAGFEFSIELWVEVSEMLIDVFVEDEGEHRSTGVDSGVADEEPVDEQAFRVEMTRN